VIHHHCNSNPETTYRQKSKYCLEANALCAKKKKKAWELRHSKMYPKRTSDIVLSWHRLIKACLLFHLLFFQHNIFIDSLWISHHISLSNTLPFPVTSSLLSTLVTSLTSQKRSSPYALCIFSGCQTLGGLSSKWR
jgi:hypothetical protein